MADVHGAEFEVLYEDCACAEVVVRYTGGADRNWGTTHGLQGCC